MIDVEKPSLMSLMALGLGWMMELPKSKQWNLNGQRLVISTTALTAMSLTMNLMIMFLKRKEISMKELKVGERVTITLEAVEAVKGKGCDGCFFDGRYGGYVAISLGIECTPKYRSDHKNVIFKEVKE